MAWHKIRFINPQKRTNDSSPPVQRVCQKPDREGGPHTQTLLIQENCRRTVALKPIDAVASVALAYARVSDTPSSLLE